MGNRVWNKCGFSSSSQNTSVGVNSTFFPTPMLPVTKEWLPGFYMCHSAIVSHALNVGTTVGREKPQIIDCKIPEQNEIQKKKTWMAVWETTACVYKPASSVTSWRLYNTESIRDRSQQSWLVPVDTTNTYQPVLGGPLPGHVEICAHWIMIENCSKLLDRKEWYSGEIHVER